MESCVVPAKIAGGESRGAAVSASAQARNKQERDAAQQGDPTCERRYRDGLVFGRCRLDSADIQDGRLAIVTNSAVEETGESENHEDDANGFHFVRPLWA
jgi:hypothetical protein